MASSVNTQKDYKRFWAAFVPNMSKLRQLLFIVLSLLVLPNIALAQDDDDKPTALIFTAQGQAFNEVVAGITGDLEEELSFETYMVGKSSKVSEIEEQMKKLKPKVVILVENVSINLYTKYQKKNPDAEFPPAIALAALFVDRYLAKLKNATGIRYEIPAVTSIVNMRGLLSKEVKKVGVVHRKWTAGMVAENARYCAREGIELISYELPNKDSSMDKKLTKGLKTLIDKDVDALWILNDNSLLNPQMFRSSWLPVVGKADLPVIVGVRPFLNTKWNFGSFAIVPDHYALGVQAASIIGELMDDDWEIGDRDIEQPVSVKKVVNISVLDSKDVKYRKDKLSQMDEVVQ